MKLKLFTSKSTRTKQKANGKTRTGEVVDFGVSSKQTIEPKPYATTTTRAPQVTPSLVPTRTQQPKKLAGILREKRREAPVPTRAYDNDYVERSTKLQRKIVFQHEEEQRDDDDWDNFQEDDDDEGDYPRENHSFARRLCECFGFTNLENLDESVWSSVLEEDDGTMDDTRTECSMEEPSELEKTKRRSSSKKTISPRGTSKSSGSRSEGGSSNGETKVTKRYLNEPKYSVVHNVNNAYAKKEVQRMETIQQVESDDSIVRTDTDIGIYAHEEESAVGASLAPTQDAVKAPLYGDSSRQSQKGGINNFIDMSAGIDEVLLSESLTKEEVIEGAKADDAGVAVESLVMDDIGASFVGLMRQYNLNEDPGVESQMQRRKAVDQHNARQGHVGPSIMGHFANSLQTFQREHHLTDTLPEHQHQPTQPNQPAGFVPPIPLSPPNQQQMQQYHHYGIVDNRYAQPPNCNVRRQRQHVAGGGDDLLASLRNSYA